MAVDEAMRSAGGDTGDDEEEANGPLSPRWKTLGIAFLVDLASIPLIFVLLYIWPIVVLAVIPYVGGSMGGRRVDRRTGLYVGAAAAVLANTVLWAIVFVILASLPFPNFDPFEIIGLSLMTATYAVTALFGAMGGRHGAIAAEESE